MAINMKAYANSLYIRVCAKVWGFVSKKEISTQSSVLLETLLKCKLTFGIL